MKYIRQVFKNGQVLTAQHLNNMVAAIEILANEAEANYSNFNARVKKLESSSVPIFDLATLGLEPIPMDGTPVQCEMDTAEIRAALNNGEVKFVANANMGEIAPVSIIMNSLSVDGTYFCTNVISVDDMSMILTFLIDENGVVGTFSPMAAGGGSALAPVFDLVSMGMETLVMGEEPVQFETDTTAIMEALNNGEVKFIVNADMGEVAAIEATMNPFKAQGAYLCSSIIAMGYDNAVLSLIVADGMIIGMFAPLSSGEQLPTVTVDDNGKFLRVVDGVWAAVSLTDVSTEGA